MSENSHKTEPDTERKVDSAIAAFHREWDPEPLPPELTIEAARWIPALRDFGIEYNLDGGEDEQWQLDALARLESIPLAAISHYSHDAESRTNAFSGKLRVEIDFASDSDYSWLQGAVLVSGDWDNDGLVDDNFSAGRLFEMFLQRADLDVEEDYERDVRDPLKEGDVSLPFRLNPSFF